MSKKLIASRLRELDNAQDYPTWREIALDLDRLEGGDAWKQDEMSEDYDYLLIRERLAQMRELRRSGNVRRLVHDLAEGLHGNLGNTANPLLYAYTRFGTKRLIEEYVEEAARCLDYICAGDFPDFSAAEKVLFFKRTGTSFGRSALLLSGGATLGMFHLGVIKALFEAGILPRVISGSSAGSIIGSMVCTRTDEELPSLFDPESLNLDAFQGVSLRQVFQSRSLMDPQQLQECLTGNILPGSFLEAFERTRRILGVTVSPAEPNQQPRLLNYLTAPNVVVRSAVMASCAVPGVFPPVMLEAEDYSGNTVPYMRSKRWVDGSIANDLPMLRLARLHNVNHYIVSQTNPHVVPFMREQSPRKRGLFGLAREVVAVTGRDALKVAREYSGSIPGGRIVDALNDILQQRYSGDISIFPRQTAAQLMRLFANLSHEDLRRFIQDGERATWPKLERVRMQTRISRAFEDCLARLKAQGLRREAAASRAVQQKLRAAS
jgi:TAG lipase / steryl ester hydrolase / phospholipase A2 / LPA acyltransferase